MGLLSERTSIGFVMLRKWNRHWQRMILKAAMAQRHDCGA
jgi:hypothetical protein